MQSTPFYLSCLDARDRRNIERRAKRAGVKFATMVARLVKTGIRRREASLRYARRRAAELRASR